VLSVEPFSYQPSQENQGFGDRGNLRRSQMKHRDGDTSATFSRLLTCKDARGAWQDILSLHLPVKRRKFAASIASLFSSFLCRVVIQASSMEALTILVLVIAAAVVYILFFNK